MPFLHVVKKLHCALQMCPAMLTNAQPKHDTCEIIRQPLRHQQKTSLECAAAEEPAPSAYPCIKHSRPEFALQNTTPVSIRHTLDLAHYCSKEALPSKPRYELVAVANHMGSRGSGHCTANCRSAVDEQWYLCNDNAVHCSRYQESPSQLA